MLPAGPHAFLAGGGPEIVPFFLSLEDPLEGYHPGIGK
jgi:hypothetical protein